jgi:hypothetical protein
MAGKKKTKKPVERKELPQTQQSPAGPANGTRPPG